MTIILLHLSANLLTIKMDINLQRIAAIFFRSLPRVSPGKFFPAIALLLASSFQIAAQDKLYTNEFPLQDVTLEDSLFRHARDLNIRELLKYDVDRLLYPYRKEAGLTTSVKGFSNWDGLDGHVGGHYLTALAMNYAATGNRECKQRMDYMLSQLQECAQANAAANSSWAKGYVGGVPNSAAVWTGLQKADLGPLRGAWVPWYNVHKMFAGLRDAWMYTGNELARKLFLDFCDWAINITAGLNDQQMQSMLDIEYGGMNEVLVDAFNMTGDHRYAAAALRFSHKMLLDAMAAGKDNLDNKHANTQVPKVIGFQRIGELTGDTTYDKAASFFWTTVTTNRSLAFGGNSRREFFPAAGSSIDFINDVEGPESCNSYNMLKLTEGLFRERPSAAYVDYYERTLYNHILSTQHPVHGGYVYFTPARPRHYRVYSAPNEGMWCCVGSGMENHGKYGQFIYTHHADSLYVNLFVASELNWREKGIKIKQETGFPFEEQTRLTIHGGGNFNLLIRYPFWVKNGAFRITINGKPYPVKASPSSYVGIQRNWKDGDKVTVNLPMQNRIEQLPNVPDYIAVMHGPVLLGAKTGTEDLRGLIAGDSRWGHIASGKKMPLNEAPIIIENNSAAINSALKPISHQPLHFTAASLRTTKTERIVFEPFFGIHDARYMIYWMKLSPTGYRAYLDSLAKEEAVNIALQKRTVDFVAPGEQQPEADHSMDRKNSNSGNTLDHFWRDARDNGYFTYTLSTNNETDLSLGIRYLGAERGNRKFDIYIDDEKLTSEDNTGKWPDQRFVNVEYKIPEKMVKGKTSVKLRFQASAGSTAGPVFYIRLLRNNK